MSSTTSTVGQVIGKTALLALQGTAPFFVFAMLYALNLAKKKRIDVTMTVLWTLMVPFSMWFISWLTLFIMAMVIRHRPADTKYEPYLLAAIPTGIMIVGVGILYGAFTPTATIDDEKRKNVAKVLHRDPAQVPDSLVLKVYTYWGEGFEKTMLVLMMVSVFYYSSVISIYDIISHYAGTASS